MSSTLSSAIWWFPNQSGLLEKTEGKITQSKSFWIANYVRSGTKSSLQSHHTLYVTDACVLLVLGTQQLEAKSLSPHFNTSLPSGLYNKSGNINTAFLSSTLAN